MGLQDYDSGLAPKPQKKALPPPKAKAEKASILDTKTRQYLDEGRAIVQKRLEGSPYSDIYMADLTDDYYIGVGRGDSKEQGEGLTRGLMRDVGGGLADLGEMYGRGIRALPGGAEAGVGEGVGGRIITGVKGVKEQYDLEPKERTGISRWIHGGIRAATTSLAAGAPGALAGVAATSWIPIPGARLLGGIIGYAVGGATLFGVAEYDSTLEEALSAGVDPEKAEAAAIRNGLFEGGFEFGADILEGVTMGAGRVVTAPAKAALKNGIKSMFKVGTKQALKRGVGVAGIEVGSEMLTAGMQTEEYYKLGLTKQRFYDAAIEAFGPALVASLIFGGVAEGGLQLNRRRLEKVLKDPEANPEERMAVVQEVAAQLQKVDKDLAKQWQDSASAAVINGEAIPTDETVPGDVELEGAIEDREAKAEELYEKRKSEDKKKSAARRTLEQGEEETEIKKTAKDILTEDFEGAEPLEAEEAAAAFTEEELEEAISEPKEKAIEPEPDKGIKPEPEVAAKPEEVKTVLKEEIPDFKDTTEAETFGKKATPEQITELKRLKKESEVKHDALAKEGKLDEAGEEASRAQFYREAFEVAPKKAERRKDVTRRKLISEMSPEEMKKELLVNPVTGIPNKRAYQESETTDLEKGITKPKAYIDVDSLKYVNDFAGHAAGDELLQAVAKEISGITPDSYHISGDEFIIRAKTEAEARKLADKLNEKLSEVELEFTNDKGEKYTYKGLGVSYGVHKEEKEADRLLRKHKEEREAEGLRARRGERPPGLRGKDTGEGRRREGEISEKGIEAGLEDRRDKQEEGIIGETVVSGETAVFIESRALGEGEVDYELSRPKDPKDKTGFVRIYDSDSGEVVGIQQYATFDQAKAEYDKSRGVVPAKAGTPKPAEPKPPEAVKEEIGVKPIPEAAPKVPEAKIAVEKPAKPKIEEAKPEEKTVPKKEPAKVEEPDFKGMSLDGVTVKIEAIRESTGETIIVSEDAKTALKSNGKEIEKYSSLLACL